MHSIGFQGADGASGADSGTTNLLKRVWVGAGPVRCRRSRETASYRLAGRLRRRDDRLRREVERDAEHVGVIDI